MRLSEALKQDHDSGDFGQALAGYSEKAAQLEDALREAMEWNWMEDDMPEEVVKVCEEALSNFKEMGREIPRIHD